MNDERLKILKMLENGDITADEASKLLSIISNASNSSANNSSANNNTNRNFDNNNNNNINKNNSNAKNNSTNKKVDIKIDMDMEKFIDKATNMANKVGREAINLSRDIEKKIKGIFKNNNYTIDMQKEYNYTLLSPENNINIKGLNGEVVVKGYNGDKLTIKIVYKANYNTTSDTNNTEIVYQENNNFYINFNENNFSKVSTEILLPSKYFDKININATNCNYLIDGVFTKNIYCDTINSNGIIENSTSDSINMDSNNGKIIVRNINTDNMKIESINENAKLVNVDCKNLFVSVLNDKISIVNDYLNKYKDYNWELEAQNDSINIEINTDNVNYDFEGSASFGSINILKNNIVYYEKDNSKVVAKSENIKETFKNLKINAETTNASIILV